MKLDQETIEWTNNNIEIVRDIMFASFLVENGKIELYFQDGKYIGTDAITRRRIKKKNV